MNSKSAIFSFLLVFSTGLVLASPLSSEEAERAYNTALVVEQRCPFYSYETSRDTGRGPATTKHYFKQSEAGIRLFRSDEVCIHKNTRLPLSTSIYHNMEGRWTVVGTTAVKMPALIDPSIRGSLDLNEIAESDDERSQSIEASLTLLREHPESNRDRFTGRRETVDGKELLMIEIEFNADKRKLFAEITAKKVEETRAVLESLQLKPREIDRQIQETLKATEKMIPASISIIIDAKNMFIIERRVSNDRGFVVQEKIRRNLQVGLQTAPPDRFFDIPHLAKRYFPADITDYQSELKRAWRKQLGKKHKYHEKVTRARFGRRLGVVERHCKCRVLV